MITGMRKYQDDYNKLLEKGDLLFTSIKVECFPVEMEKQMKVFYKDETDNYIKSLPTFKKHFQGWYSESLVLIKQILPSRVADFVRYYERPKTRKEITYENYVIEDYLQGLTLTRNYDNKVIVGPSAAIPKFEQQVEIIRGLNSRFESSLYDIKQLVQADLLDDELSAANELLKNNFIRASGSIAGVVLEKHLKEVVDKHELKITKKNITISDCYEALKNNEIIDTPTWRFLQHLGDLRNICDHSKDKEPTKEQIEDLISGVEKVTKTLY